MKWKQWKGPADFSHIVDRDHAFQYGRRFPLIDFPERDAPVFDIHGKNSLVGW
jgi:hypothetical protein